MYYMRVVMFSLTFLLHRIRTDESNHSLHQPCLPKKSKRTVWSTYGQWLLYMSSEHPMSEKEDDNNDQSGSDSERKHVKTYSISILPWRSAELGDSMHHLERKYNWRRSAKSTNMTFQRKSRGIVSSHPAPEDTPSFALA